ncbi:hypothetical protein Vadar_014088 [Vaccinium darrowii]|uniref:Uncharacterized protein n=1 Tax=Vaccinium darrowii TaxID=229202 RepID=A0ACB7ZC46_9ERIC|nr:hypothetical protein Vadar_014088 [Vaccinium darrowii]
MVKAFQLLAPSLSSVRSFISLYSSTGLRPIAANNSAFNRHLLIARASSTYTRSKMESEHYMFGPYKIHQKEVFYSTDLSYAMVNLRPLLPGHILFWLH